MLGFLELLHHTINSSIPLLPNMLLVLPGEVKKVHPEQFPASLTFAAKCT